MTTKKKIIVLDIDGVLVFNTPRCHKVDAHGSLFASSCVENLKKILDATNADIVISSTWRLSGIDRMLDCWKSRNMPGKIIGITPDIRKKSRGHEIKQWINNNGSEKEISFCILDDDDDMLPEQLNNFVCIDSSTGLTEIDADKAIRILNRSKS